MPWVPGEGVCLGGIWVVNGGVFFLPFFLFSFLVICVQPDWGEMDVYNLRKGMIYEVLEKQNIESSWEWGKAIVCTFW